MADKHRDKTKHIIEMAPQKDFEERFSFIKDDVLRKNTAISFEYIVFLIEIFDIQKPKKIIASAIYKDMILYTATIVEGCLHYCLKEFIKSEIVDESKIMPSDWKEEARIKIYSISKDKEVCGIVRHKKIEPLKEDTIFVVINRACKKAEILTDTLFEKAEDLRIKRNNIHLASLKTIDNSYTKSDAQKYFDIAREIISQVEEKTKILPD